ncbi:TIGR01841 family phasin [Zobellella maritima]|uniref:TIGR01841 family phasin n=1 Tax=Zobellella maritima TaxID=2059725 RepID=UPI000E307AFD|nr:TIGR01841 family phasin [Zobellella maritima]
MSFFDFDKIQNAQKANLELLQQLNGALFTGAEQLGQLQAKALRTIGEECFENAAKFYAVRDAQAFAELQLSLFNPTVQLERALEFNREALSLISGVQADIAKLGEQQVAAGTKQAKEVVDALVKNAPAGSEPAVAALKSVMANADSAYESAQKATKQAVEMADNAGKKAAEFAENAAKQAAEIAEKTTKQAAETGINAAAAASKNNRAASKASA